MKVWMKEGSKTNEELRLLLRNIYRYAEALTYRYLTSKIRMLSFSNQPAKTHIFSNEACQVTEAHIFV